MKAVTRDQTHEIIGRVIRNTNWSNLDGEAIQKSTGVVGMSEQEFGRRFTAFLKNGANFEMKGPGVFTIDRTKPFDPASFIVSGWSIWRGPKDGSGLEGEEAQDVEALKLSEIDFANVTFTSCLKEGELSITGEEKLLRHVAAGHIRLGAKEGQALLEESGQATLIWLYTAFNVDWFELPGTELRDPIGDRYFLYLCRSADGRWDWRYDWLGHDRDAGDVSAVLAR